MVRKLYLLDQYEAARSAGLGLVLVRVRFRVSGTRVTLRSMTHDYQCPFNMLVAGKVIMHIVNSSWCVNSVLSQASKA